jgi:protein-S-isoprenylcysteine O-methyltransferase Ste14
MIYIVIGVVGFFAIYLFDLVSLKRISLGIKPFLWTAGCGLLLYSVVMLCLEPATLPISNWLTWVGWGLLLVSLFMIMLTLFVKLPFRKTYVDSGVGDKLVKTGLYALIRHPGLYWVATFMFSLVLISRSSLMLMAAPIFVFVNTVLVIIEDKYLFVKMFDGYDEYQKETPMLIPNRRSIKAFVNSIKGSKSGMQL